MRSQGRNLAILTLISISIGMIFFIPDTFAQSQASITPEKDSFQLLYEGLGIILNLIYIITLPLLMIAGKAMDNSMVYGEFLNLDKPLYMLWNISRTFANFAIGGTFLYHIIKYIFTPTKDTKDVKDTIIKGAGAALGINFSRFALGALLDLSTILTYSLGSMPLSILNQFGVTQANMPILAVNNFFNYESLDTSNTNPNGKTKNYLYYQRGNINISPCGKDGKIFKGFITGPQYSNTLPHKESVSFQVPCAEGDCKRYCATSTLELHDITALEQWKDANLQTYVSDTSTIDTATQYNDLVQGMIEELSANKCQNGSITFTGGVNSQAITINKSLLTGASGFVAIIPSVYSESTLCSGEYKVIQNTSTNDPANPDSRKKSFLTDGNNKPYNKPNGLSMTKLLDKSRGMVGVFVTLYMTLLDFSNISLNDNNNTSVTEAVGGITEFLIRAIIGIGLLLPLLSLAVALIMRIGLLWGLIAFSPLGIVVYALFDIDKWLPSDSILKKIDVNNIIGLIFAPIIQVFVLSMSIIFIQALHGQMIKDVDKEQSVRSFLGMNFNRDNNNDTTCADFWGLQQLCYKTSNDLPNGSVFVNLFPRLFVNIFAIAIMWFLVKMSFNASPLTAGVAQGVMDIGGKLLGSIPLIQIPGIGGVGFDGLKYNSDRIMGKLGQRAEILDKPGEDRLTNRVDNRNNTGTNPNLSGTKNDNYTTPPKITNFTKQEDFKKHIFDEQGEVIKQNISTQKITEKINQLENRKLIDAPTISGQAEQIIGLINEISIKDPNLKLDTIYNTLFIEGIAQYAIGDINKGRQTKVGLQDSIIDFLNGDNISTILKDPKNSELLNRAKKITYTTNNQTKTIEYDDTNKKFKRPSS